MSTHQPQEDLVAKEPLSEVDEITPSQSTADDESPSPEFEVTPSSPLNNTEATEEPLRAFTCFPRLPPELRLIVWEQVCCQTRNVPLRAVSMDFTRLVVSSSTEGVFRYSTNLPPPSVLSTCRESRDSGLKHYTLLFRTTFDIGHGIMVRAPARIYINADSDRICPVGEFSLDVVMDFGCRWKERVAPNANSSTNREDEGIVFPSRLIEHMEEWLDGEVREVLVYDEIIGGNKSSPMEFEGAELGGIKPDVQERISEFLHNLQRYFDTFDEDVDRRIRRAWLAALHEWLGCPVPEQFDFEKHPRQKPLMKVVRVKKAATDTEQ
ncbi:hypothetical protein BKA64DRAFT_670728 [Cadophora sp. MPI-SDFR-AT-0126]|nr:hypothetical protein BKA64DRAFT_670728 [Leotiomycetes sp. MPI-SDFR-AT-0126]